MYNKLLECKKCIEDKEDKEDNPLFYIEDDHINFNSIYCITECTNETVPSYIPQEQVIKYLKTLLYKYNIKLSFGERNVNHRRHRKSFHMPKM